MSWLADADLWLRVLRMVEIIAVLGGIILVHEFGHYIVGKWSGMAVDEFAIGVGPTIREWQRGGTKYRLCWFLFMGYVRIRGLEGESDADVAEGSFYSRPHGQRMLAILAGSAMNVLTAALLFCLLYGIWGVPDVRSDNTISQVVPNSAAAAAGLEPGWRIISVDGRPTPLPEPIEQAVRASRGRPLRFVLEREGVRREVTITPRYHPEDRRYLVGVAFRNDGACTNVIDRVDPGGPAGRAGLERGDRIIGVDGRRVDHPIEILDKLSYVPPALEHAEPYEVGLKPLRVEFLRNGVRLETTVEPEARKRQRLKPSVDGRAVKLEDAEVESYLEGDVGLTLERRYKHLGVVGALARGLDHSRRIVGDILEQLGLLARGRHLDQVGGPVAILKVLSDAAFVGLYDLIEMAGTLSIMIGFFNLLPLPALDGGRAVFIALEWLRGRPVIGRVRESQVHTVGLLLLLGLMVLISIRDLRRW